MRRGAWSIIKGTETISECRTPTFSCRGTASVVIQITPGRSRFLPITNTLTILPKKAVTFGGTIMSILELVLVPTDTEHRIHNHVGTLAFGKCFRWFRYNITIRILVPMTILLVISVTFGRTKIGIFIFIGTIHTYYRIIIVGTLTFLLLFGWWQRQPGLLMFTTTALTLIGGKGSFTRRCTKIRIFFLVRTTIHGIIYGSTDTEIFTTSAVSLVFIGFVVVHNRSTQHWFVHRFLRIILLVIRGSIIIIPVATTVSGMTIILQLAVLLWSNCRIRSHLVLRLPSQRRYCCCCCRRCCRSNDGKQRKPNCSHDEYSSLCLVHPIIYNTVLLLLVQWSDK